MSAHPPRVDDAVMLGSRSSSEGLRAGALSPPAVLVDDALASYIDWRADERAVG
jgi:hypothetical protein